MHRNNKTPARSQGQAATFLIGVATFLVLLPLLMFSHRQSRTTAAAKRRLTSGQYDTLVIYNFGYWDPEHLGNFNYFIKHAIRGNDGARYAIILEHLIATELLDLPPFPSNVQVVRAVGPCNEMGLAGWLLKRYPNLLQHKYYVFVDSSVRGPFLPAYVDMPWHRLLTQRITDTTKLVGSTISCTPFKYKEDETGYVIYPYVQGYVTATDQVGMGVLNSTQPSVFHCFHDRMDIQRFGVISMSEAMLRNNYNIGSLMLKYQDVDFRDGSKWACNDRVDPHADGHYDGTSLNPLEVMFVRVDHTSLVTEVPNAYQALKYEVWAQAKKGRGKEDISSNEWKQRAIRLLPLIKARGYKCFNAKFYIANFPYEFRGWTGEQAWSHFLEHGFEEGRPYEFTC